MNNLQPLAATFDLEHHRLQLWRQLAHATRDSSASETIPPLLEQLRTTETFWAYPGQQVMTQMQHYLNSGSCALCHQLASNVFNALNSGAYRRQPFIPFHTNLMSLDSPVLSEVHRLTADVPDNDKNTFEVLIVHPAPVDYELLYRQSLSAFISDRDEFLYDIFFVDSAEDALIAILANPTIQAVVFVPGFQHESTTASALAQQYLGLCPYPELISALPHNPLAALNALIEKSRPEIDQYLISEQAPHELSPDSRQQFRKILFHINPFQDLHNTLLNGIRERFSTPFFHALQAYSRKPRGVFHALPLSQGQSIINAHWIDDMLQFYGSNLFLAETSSTQGGLDSLLDPKGAIKQSHEKVAKTFGADSSYFVTNGTSTSNKIVMQTTLAPGDIVLISADCHKSIPYSVMLTGAHCIFLETYPLMDYDLYGAVTLQRIKQVMLDLKQHGKLDRLRQITLTNSTFDGIIYNTERFMLDILAIKPDIIFHWDEAWFAFAHFNPVYHGRSAMSVAKRLSSRFQQQQYQTFYQQWITEFDAEDETQWLEQPLFPDPQRVKLRVYVTQSTHKTLSSFRQGSMIHITDNAFDEERFLEAYRTHTSTSPNYQILASLDIARRQVALEGYEQVKKTLYLANSLREQISQSAVLKDYFKVLSDQQLIPQAYRSPETATPSTWAYLNTLKNWGDSLFVVDPTRVTVDVSATGLDGSSFRQLLINHYDIQVNKTSRKTVLFIINIGTTETTVNYLLSVLHEIAQRLKAPDEHSPPKPMSEVVIDLPQTRVFNAYFQPFSCHHCQVIDIRKAYYAAYDDQLTEYINLDNATIKRVLNDLKLVSATFITPYPPGFPVVVPGQIITYDILMYLQKIKVKEIHGYRRDYGLKIFKADFLQRTQEDQ